MSDERRLAKRPTTVAMFRMSAVMWNAHRIHFDQEYATRVEGHPGVLVPANLLSSYVCQLAMGWGGPQTRLLRLDFRVVSPVVAGSDLTIRGHETDRRVDEHDAACDLVDLDMCVDAKSDTGATTAVTAAATVRVPRALPAQELGAGS